MICPSLNFLTKNNILYALMQPLFKQLLLRTYYYPADHFVFNFVASFLKETKVMTNLKHRLENHMEILSGLYVQAVATHPTHYHISSSK